MYCIEEKHCLLGLFSSSPIDLDAWGTVPSCPRRYAPGLRSTKYPHTVDNVFILFHSRNNLYCKLRVHGRMNVTDTAGLQITHLCFKQRNLRFSYLQRVLRQTLKINKLFIFKAKEREVDMPMFKHTFTSQLI